MMSMLRLYSTMSGPGGATARPFVLCAADPDRGEPIGDAGLEDARTRGFGCRHSHNQRTAWSSRDRVSGSHCSDRYRGVPHREAAPTTLIAAPIPTSSSSTLSGGNWSKPPAVGTPSYDNECPSPSS
jgi:hypothetical protein